MSNDMLSRIRNRSNRTTVPPRDTSLADVKKDEAVTGSAISDSPSLSTLPPEEIIEELVETAPRRQIRLEQSIDDRLAQLCQTERLTVETFLEATFLACSRDEKLMRKVITEAKERLKERKRAGRIRRLRTEREAL